MYPTISSVLPSCTSVSSLPTSFQNSSAVRRSSGFEIIVSIRSGDSVMMASHSVRCTLNVAPDILSVRLVFSSFDMTLANTRLTMCVRPSMTAIFLSCSAASIVTKLASGNSSRATPSSFFASFTGIEMMFLPFTCFVPGPNIGCMHIGLIFEGIFERADIVRDFCEDISMRYVPRIISLAMSRMISGVRLVGVHSTT